MASFLRSLDACVRRAFRAEPMTTTNDANPPANAFTHSFVVPDSDIDELGHAGNVTWVRWVNEAATAHSTSVGLGLDAYRALGLLWVVRRHEIDYLAPAFAGERVDALTWIDSVRGATALRRTLFLRSASETPLARAATTWALVAISTGRPTRVPPELGLRYGFGGG
jgi:acyl-CoA thioester hydrolase